MDPTRIQTIWRLAAYVWFIAAPMICLGQQPVAQFPPTNPQSPWVTAPPPNGTIPPGAYVPPPTGIPPGYGAPPVYPSANPYGTPTYPGWNLSQLFGLQPTAPVYGANPYGSPAPMSSQPMGQPTYPPSVYPNATPNVLFPTTGGVPGQPPPYQLTPYQQNPYQVSPYQVSPYQTNPYGQPQYPSMMSSTQATFTYGTNQVIRAFQGPRFRTTWLPGGDSGQPDSLQILDADVSFVFACPRFLYCDRPFYIIPSYSQHEWTGPTATGSDLPGSAFSAFMDFGMNTDPQQTMGFELGVRVGVFSAFDAVNSESVRYPVKALGRLRLTPTSTFRAGVYYIDRNRIKLLPALGLLWLPNQDTRFDLFFPEPKLSHYVSTIGKSDVWWYLSGYYGGGAWTIKHTDGSSDEIDINDIRVMLGLEFGKSEQIRQGFRFGFIEGGYSFNRELLYRVRSSGNLDLEDSFVLRAGFAY